MKKNFFFYFFCLFNFFAFGQVCDWTPPHPVQEIAYPIPDLAMVNFFNGQWVIFYNPELFKTVPNSVKLFTRAHEYAHIELNHFVGLTQSLYQMIKLSRENELAADTQAADWLIESECSQIVSEMTSFFDSVQYRNMALPPWYPSYTERRDNLMRILGGLGEPVEFSIEIPPISMGELGGIIDIWIDDENVGTISNFSDDYDTSIDIDQFKPGVYNYRLRVKVYIFREFNPFYYRTIIGSGSINILENDRFIIVNGASNPSLQKYR